MDAGQYHDHYLLQAEWLAPGRHWLYRKIGLARHERILDFGCGSGVIGEEIRQIGGRPVLGVDRDPEMVRFAQGRFPGNRYRCADENDPILGRQRFDLIVLSFVLLWQPRPLPFLKKIRKLLLPEGKLLVLAEPDYGGRIDFPPALEFLKDIFTATIQRQGGDPFFGRTLKAHLDRAGFSSEVGLASHLDFPGGHAGPAWEREWRFWQQLAGLPDPALKKIVRLEKHAARSRERLVVFPVFYAIAAPVKK